MIKQLTQALQPRTADADHAELLDIVSGAEALK